MATKFFFNNKKITLPGVYATIKSGIKNPPQDLDYGRVLIIDTGSGANYGGGAGVKGELATGQDSVYQFTNSNDFKEFVKGGIWWKLAEPLFKPDGTNATGVSTLYWVKAATTVAAELTFSPTGGGTAGGTFVLQVKDEGIIGNGVEVSDVLTKGYAFTMESGTVDTNKFVLKFWKGVYKGLHTDGIPYDGVYNTEVVPVLIAQSDEFDNVDTLFTWAAKDANLNAYFKVKTATKTGTGAVTAADKTLFAGNTLAAGGTETYNALAEALEAVADLDYTFLISDQSGDDAQSVSNASLLSHLTEEKYEKFMVVGGGSDNTKFTQTDGSIPTAQYYNSDKVIVVHGGIKEASNLTGSGFREYDVMYKVCAVTGRICGLAPQVPVTFKSIKIAGEQHNLTKKEREMALNAGVLTTHYDSIVNAFVVEQGINSLQTNDNVVNEDGTSYSIQVRRITSQINKELVVNARKLLLGQPFGVNRNTLSEKNIEDWTKAYLDRKVATTTNDNLILSYQDVSVSRNQDAYQVTYSIVPNGEITKIFFTGFLID